MSYRGWGLLQGPLLETAVSVGAGSTVVLLDASSAPRTVDERLKTLIVSNPSTNTSTMYLGTVNVSESAFTVALDTDEFKPAVFDMQDVGARKLYAYNPSSAAQILSVAQTG